MGKNKQIDFVSGIVTGILSLYVIFDSIRMYKDAGEKFFYSPALMPFILGLGLLICTAMLLGRSLKGAKLSDILAQVKESAVSLIQSETIRRALGGLVIMGAYVFILLPLLGFVVATLIFLFVMMLYMKVGNIVKVAVISVIVVSAVYLVFNVIFGVLLP